MHLGHTVDSTTRANYKRFKRKTSKNKTTVTSKRRNNSEKNKAIKKATKMTNELKSMWNSNVLKRDGNLQFMHAQNNIETTINNGRPIKTYHLNVKRKIQ